MGQAKNRKQRFLLQHPRCCFCGGSEPAVQEDHVPPRSAFLGRNWPEGYVFPACAQCNNGTAVEDRLFALAAFVDANQPSADQRKEWQALLREVARDHPGLPQRMLLSANAKRRYLQSMELTVPEGKAAGEVGLVQLPPEMLQAVDVVLLKLARAIHYKQTGRIVPADGHVHISYFPPQELGKRMEATVLPLFTETDKMVRNGVDLGSQFSCRYQVSDDGELGAYFFQIRTSISAVMLVSLNQAIDDEAVT